IAKSMLAALVVAVAALASPPAASDAASRSPRAAATFPAVGKIKHVVVMYQENRSFDEVLGQFCIVNHRCDGSVAPVRLKGGSAVPLTKSPDVVYPDPPHETATQVRAIDAGKMDGWGNLGSMCHSPGKNLCLTYYEPSQIPSLAALASKYVVSDRTFS